MEYNYLTLKLPLYLINGLENLKQWDKANKSYYHAEVVSFLSAKLYEKLQDVEKEIKSELEKQRIQELDRLQREFYGVPKNA